MKKVVFLLACISAVFAFFDPDYVSKAENELTLHYIDNKIYYPVYCRSEKVDGEYYILCSSGSAGADRKQGGLFKVVKGNGDSYSIFAINGKGMQHSKGKYEEYRGASLDISKIIDEF
jgi:hypothetical protein|nr:MAG TPA: hypothetical protein [Caudoviricetes sp.]